MIKKKLNPLKVSFYGMNDRVQKLMVNSLKMLKSRIDIEVVEGIEGQVEIIDLDLSIYNLNLLEDRLGQRPIKPIIVLSLNEVTSDKVIYIKKPFQSEQLLDALLKANTVLQEKFLVNSVGSIPESEAIFKAGKVNTSKLDNKSDLSLKGEEELPRKIKWTRISNKTGSTEVIAKELEVASEIEVRTVNISSSSDEVPRGVRWTRNGKSYGTSEKSAAVPTVNQNIIGKLDNEYHGLENVAEDIGITFSSELDAVELDVTLKKKSQTDKVTKPKGNTGNSGNLYEQSKAKISDPTNVGRKTGGRTVNSSSLRNEIAKRKKMSHLADLQSRNLIHELDLDGGFVNRRRSIRYAFDNLKGYFIPNSLILRNRRKSILILDISSKGAYFRCNSKLKLETKGELVFDFGLAAVYKISAQIVRVNGGAYSIDFKEYNHEICDFLIDSGRMFEIKTHF